MARARDPDRPPITAADVLAAVHDRPGVAPDFDVALHGEACRVIVDGADLRVYRGGTTVWAGRLVAYPAALKVDAAEGAKVYPCPRCGGAVTAHLAADRPAADCPGCGARLALVLQGRPDPNGRWIDLNRWSEGPD